MNINALKSKMILSAALFFILSTFSCGMKHNIKGRVLNAETGQPIEGAVVSIHWYYYRLSHQLIGFTSGYKKIAVYETLSDPNGYFESTRHLKGEHDFAVYKKGYVCWYEDYIFKKKKKKKKREDYKLKDDMIIKLEPLKKQYDLYEHAKFVMGSRYGHDDGPIFNKAIKDETLLYYYGKP